MSRVSVKCSFGTTTTCVGACGAMSRKASTRSVSSTVVEGTSPATIAQNRQSLMPPSWLVAREVEADAPAQAEQQRHDDGAPADRGQPRGGGARRGRCLHRLRRGGRGVGERGGCPDVDRIEGRGAGGGGRDHGPRRGARRPAHPGGRRRR